MPPNMPDGPRPDTGDRPRNAVTQSISPSTQPPTLKRRGRYPLASASLYTPVPGRGWCWLSIRCPRCGGVHLGRVRSESQAAGLRRTSCGTVWVIVRQTYRGAA